MNELSTERAIEALYTIRAYYASLTAGYPKGKDRRGIGDVMCSEIANSCLMAIKALEQTEPEKHGDCISRQEVSDIIKTRLYQTALNNDEYITSYAKVCEDIAENRIDTWINEAKSVKSEKCGDCISRQDVLDLAERGKLVSNGNYKSVCDAINGLPSVEPAENDVLSAENAENTANSGTKTDKSDLISRKEFLKRIEPYNTDDKMDKALYTFAYYKIMSCSSVTPERKNGKWIWDKRTGTYHCSECGHDPLHEDVGEIEEYKYCMNCGAEMGVDR